MPYEKYLSLPIVVGRAREKSFRSNLDKVRMRISNHRVETLSQDGKEIFIKAVVQALPTYTMSIFKMPNNLLRNINGVIQNFWWGQQEKEKKIHWVTWSTMGKAKSAGGKGFRDLECFNHAMLAKQCWRFIQQLDFLAS
ncbi:hypothetical protein F2P56_013449 [Juglans regia]|uniref:Uncharacterized protein n=2 Tax=Juglans regia TaxID=51240 RepID=A0A834CZ33_JUGRE|nr:uncharacterized mitochondrial protein AtMg00310-like [Juglans regia]KAF5469368.1 hypothetical protein F2P56_013449 [Juglans regia]